MAKNTAVGVPTFEEDMLMEAVIGGSSIREGGLKKKSTDSWVDRYFVLDSKCMFYGKDRRSLSLAFSRIDLALVNVQDADESVFGRHAFQLITPHKVYVLKGNNQQNKQKWMQAIKKQCLISNENRRFDQYDDEIKKREMVRTMHDSELILSSFQFTHLTSFAEGAQVLAEFVPEPGVRILLANIWEFVEHAEERPAQALDAASSEL